MELKAIKVALADCRYAIDIYFGRFNRRTSIIQFDTMYYSGLADEIDRFVKVLKTEGIRVEELPIAK